MKTSPLSKRLLALPLCATALAASGPAAAIPATTKERIGIYDSRAVAYAYFGTPAECARRDKMIAEAKAARAANDTARFQKISQTLKETQDRSHLQVFSTAPATEALAALAPRLPALQAELGVTRLVSQWDEPALRESGSAEQVDVTVRLVHEFITPTENQQKTLDSLRAAKPLPLPRAQALVRSGNL